MSDFTWIKQSNEIPIGDYTIGNTTNHIMKVNSTIGGDYPTTRQV